MASLALLEAKIAQLEAQIRTLKLVDGLFGEARTHGCTNGCTGACPDPTGNCTYDCTNGCTNGCTGNCVDGGDRMSEELLASDFKTFSDPEESTLKNK